MCDHPLTFYQHSTKNYQFGNDHPGCRALDAGRAAVVGRAVLCLAAALIRGCQWVGDDGTKS